MFLNGLGALLTGITCVVVVASKLTEGAWISVLLILGLLGLFVAVRRHYDFVDQVTRTSASLAIGPPRPPIAVVPLRSWDAVSLKALQFAVGFAPEVVVVQVLTEQSDVEDLTTRWEELAVQPLQKLGIAPPRLVVLRSQYRRLFQPLVDYVKSLAEVHPDRSVAVVVPTLRESRWYHAFLHGHSATVLRSLLLASGGPQIVILEIPWYLKEWAPEHRRLGRRASLPAQRAR